MKKHPKPTKAPYPFLYTVGLGLATLALASSSADAASSSTKKAHTSHHSSHHSATPAETTYPPLPPSAQPGYAPTRMATVQPEAAAPVERSYTIGEVISESVFGDVYAEPSRWEPLGYGDLFTKGWNKPWVSPPKGGGEGPRMGWLNAYDGVFYRLSLAIFSWQHGPGDYTDGYAGTLTSYTPLSERFEVRTDIGLASTRGATGTGNSQTNFADFTITPRILLSETKEQTQVLDIGFRTPTGNSYNGQGFASINPQYNFWTNYWKGLVVRGGVGFNLPYSGQIAAAGARSTFTANVATGWYFTTHDDAPFGDLVIYVSHNLTQAIDNRGPNSTTTYTVGPGFRDHLGGNWFWLGSVDFAVTHPLPYDYQVQGAIMKVY